MKPLSKKQLNNVQDNVRLLAQTAKDKEGSYPVKIGPKHFTTICDCSKGNVVVSAKKSDILESNAKIPIAVAYVANYHCSDNCSVFDEVEVSIPLG
jgi:hypothetical protein